MMHALRFGILVLFCSSVFAGRKHRGCFSDQELFSYSRKTRLGSIRHPTEHHQHRFKSVHHESCSDFTQRISLDGLANRSLSPWTLRFKTNPSLIPSEYQEAECLCNGCIINGTENTDYVSVPVIQTFKFQKKEACPIDSKKYSLKVVYMSLPVACTCAVPRR